MSGQIRIAGTPIPRIEKDQSTAAPCTTRKMKFSEAIDFGMQPWVALEKCDPSVAKDMTKERLQICAEAGMKADDLVKAFSTTKNTVYSYCSKFRVSLRELGKGRPGSDYQPEQQTPDQEELSTTHPPAPAAATLTEGQDKIEYPFKSSADRKNKQLSKATEQMTIALVANEARFNSIDQGKIIFILGGGKLQRVIVQDTWFPGGDTNEQC